MPTDLVQERDDRPRARDRLLGDFMELLNEGGTPQGSGTGPASQIQLMGVVATGTFPREDHLTPILLPPTFILGPRSGESSTEWLAEVLQTSLGQSAETDGEPLPDVEYDAFADFRPAPTVRLSARIGRVQKAEPDLALSQADWELFAVDTDE